MILTFSVKHTLTSFVYCYYLRRDV